MLNSSIHRTLDRGKVAIAAAAALFLFATEVRANVVDFVLVQASSSIKLQKMIYGPAIGVHQSVPQAPGSDTTTYFGHMWVDITPTTIQLLPGASIRAAATGAYAPFDPVISDPVGPPPVGVTPNANYGLRFPAWGWSEVQYNIRLDNGNIFAPSTPEVLSGNSFNLAGQGMGFVDGRQAYVNGFGFAFAPNDTDSLVALWGGRDDVRALILRQQRS